MNIKTKFDLTVRIDLADVRRFTYLCKKHDMSEDEMASYLIGVASALAFTRQEEADCVRGFME